MKWHSKKLHPILYNACATEKNVIAGTTAKEKQELGGKVEFMLSLHEWWKCAEMMMMMICFRPRLYQLQSILID